MIIVPISTPSSRKISLSVVYTTNAYSYVNQYSSSGTAQAREQLFIDLYQRAFPAVARFVSRHGGTLEEAQDVFQDTLVIYYEKTVAEARGTPGFRHQAAYLLGIARHVWFQKFRSDVIETSLEDSEAFAVCAVETATPSRQKLLRFLTVAGKKCMDLLRAFYYDQLPLQEVADAFGYSGVRSATVQKYKCLEKVRTTVKEKSIRYDDFLEEN